MSNVIVKEASLLIALFVDSREIALRQVSSRRSVSVSIMKSLAFVVK